MTKELTQYQLFVMKKNNLEKKVQEYYNNTRQAAIAIQYALAVLVKNSFSAQDFSYFAKELICSLFLTSPAEELNSVRHLCVYFEDYFSTDEWAQVVARLYKNQSEYEQLTKATRIRIEKLRPILNVGEQTGDRKLTLKAAFRDENHKSHGWSLGNVVALRTSQEHRALLNILGELTIFQKKGVRRFTEVVWLDFAIDERFRDFDTRNEEDPNYQPPESEESQQEQKTKISKSTDSKQTLENQELSQGAGPNNSGSDAAKEPPQTSTSSSGKTKKRTREEILEEKRRTRGKGKTTDVLGEQAKKREQKKKERELRKKMSGNNKPKKKRKKNKRK